jgi:hypothetical protein
MRRMRSTIATARITAIAALAAALAAGSLNAACQAPLSGAPCPCVDGYTCDELLGVCRQDLDAGGSVTDGGYDPSDGSSLPFPDAAGSDAGGQPDASGEADAGGDFPDSGLPDAGLGGDAGAQADAF